MGIVSIIQARTRPERFSGKAMKLIDGIRLCTADAHEELEIKSNFP